MDIEITFPGNLKVDANLGGVVVHSDQPAAAGGDGSAPSPFNLFLASIGTCAGVYVLFFLRKRNLPTEGVHLTQHLEVNEQTGMVTKIGLDIHVPPSIPEKYHDALVKTASLCAVKKHLLDPPAFEIRTVVG